MDLSMQMKALRSANLAKLSSKSATSEAYWVTSMSAGTPAGYCLSQTRSMVFPLVNPRLSVGVVLGRLGHAGARGKLSVVTSRADARDALPRLAHAMAARDRGSRLRPGVRSTRRLVARRTLRRRLAVGLGLRGRLWLCGFRAIGRSRGGFCRRVRLRAGMPDGCWLRRLRIGLAAVIGFRLIGVGLFRGDMRLLSAPWGRLAVRIRGNGCEQTGAGAGRAGVDDDRFGGRGRSRQPFGRFWHRRLQAGGQEQRAARAGLAHAGGWRAAADTGNKRVVLVARRLVALAAAYLIAQVRRRGVDRRQILHRAERGPEPPQSVVGGKAAIEQLRGAHGAHGAGGGAQHHRDQPLAVARCRRNQVVT